MSDAPTEPGRAPEADPLRRPVLVLCLLVVLAEVAALVLLARGSGREQPHDVPLVVSAPAVVGEALADSARGLEGRPFEVTVVEDDDEARDVVQEGRALAALLVELRGTRDVLLVDPARDDALTDAVAARVRVVEARYDRTFTTEGIERPAAADGTWHAASVRAWLATLLGFLTVVVLSLLAGPVARTPLRGVVRAGVLVAVAVAGGAVLGLPWSFPGGGAAVAALLALTVLSTGLLTLALEALVGLPGMAVAAAAMFVVATPVLTGTDPLLLPRPAAALGPWVPTGASVDGTTAVALLDPGLALRPALVLVGWCVVAAAVLLLARRLGRYVDRPALARRTSPGLRPGPGRWRLRVLGVVTPLVLVVGAAVVLLPGSAAPVADLPSLASQTTCLRTGSLDTVADLNRLSSTLRASAIEGADVGADVRLQDGRTLWMFGDTLRGPGFEGPSFVRNSMLVVGDGCLRAVLPEDRGAVVPSRPDGTGYWPMSVGRVGRPGYDLVAVHAQRVRSTGEGPFDFEMLGPSVAVYVVPRGGTPQLVAQRDVGADDPDRTAPTWGAASAVHDGWVYLYGTATEDEPYVFGYSLQVARVRPLEVLEPDRWRYWNGGGWSSEESDAAKLIPAVDGVSQTLSVFERAGRWYAVSKRNDFLGTDLVVWSAPSPTGPFEPGAPVARIPSEGDTGVLRYMPLAHPELLPRRGSVVVSYSRNEGRPERVLDDPRRYRIRFLRVPLP